MGLLPSLDLRRHGTRPPFAQPGSGAVHSDSRLLSEWTSGLQDFGDAHFTTL